MTKIALKVKNLRGHILGKKFVLGINTQKHHKNRAFLDFAQKKQSLLMYRLFGLIHAP